MLKRLITFIFFVSLLSSYAQIKEVKQPVIKGQIKDTIANPDFKLLIKAPFPLNMVFNHKEAININELVDHPWPVTFQEFKKAFMEIEIDDPLANLDLHLPSPEEMRNLAYPQGGFVMSGPISMIYDQFSKETRSKEIYAGLIKKDKASKRYNKEVVSKLTGIKDEDIIEKFIEFCALQIQFILKSTDYELYAAIMNCYDEFCKTGKFNTVPGE